MGREQPPSTASPVQPAQWVTLRACSLGQLVDSISAPGRRQRLPALGTTERLGSRRVPAFLRWTLRGHVGMGPPRRGGVGAGLHSSLVSGLQIPGGLGPPQPTRLSGPRPASARNTAETLGLTGPGVACGAGPVPCPFSCPGLPSPLGSPLPQRWFWRAQVGSVVRALVRERWRALSLPGNSLKQDPASWNVLAAAAEASQMR